MVTSSLQVHLMVICKSPFLASSAHICMMFEHVEDAVSYSFILQRRGSARHTAPIHFTICLIGQADCNICSANVTVTRLFHLPPYAWKRFRSVTQERLILTSIL